MTREQKRYATIGLLVVLLVLAFFEAWRQQQPPVGDVAGELPNRNVRFGLPAPADSSREAFLIERPQYVLSYNDTTRTPNWVSWQLVASDVGKADRGPFEPDPLLPKGFAKVTEGVYTKSGFDRGHMCPSKDRSDSEENNDPTFYTTNIAPQSPNLNQKAWERLERHCRDLVRKGKELYICCGPHGVGGTGRFGAADEIGGGKVKVAVPARFWKVILVLPQGAKPGRDAELIAVVMPNHMGVEEEWQGWRVSGREVETLTGYRFFPALPPELSEALLARR